MREKHGKNPQSPQLFQLKLLSIKLTFLMWKIIIIIIIIITDEFNKYFTNIGADLANKIPNSLKQFHLILI